MVPKGTRIIDMQNLQKNLNQKWNTYRSWGKTTFLGDITVNAVRVIFTATIFLLLFYGLFIIGPFKDKEKVTPAGDNEITQNCSVTGIELYGTLVTYIPNHNENDTSFNYDIVSSQNVVPIIKQANEDENIKAVVVEVESGGGVPLAGEEIANAIKSSKKPVIALIRSTGGSSSYWAISSADKIFASLNSSVGAIGITGSYLTSTEKNKKDGYTYEELNSGKFKDSGSADKPLTEEERALFLRDIHIMYNNFIEAVAENRHIPIEKVRSFSDGSTVLGDRAKELGLIDEIGGLAEVERYLEEAIGEKAVICWE